MSQKTVKKTVKPRSPKPPAAQVDTAYLVREDLDEQQERLSKAEAAGAGTLKAPAPPAPAEQPPATATVPLKPLTPLAALWPDQFPPKAESRASQGPAPQKAPVAAIAPKPVPATAPLLARPPAQSKSRGNWTPAAGSRPRAWDWRTLSGNRVEGRLARLAPTPS